MDEDARLVVERELLLLDLAVLEDPARMLALLHPDFLEFGASGRIWDKASVAATPPRPVQPIRAIDVHAHRLGPDAFLVTYTSDDVGRRALRSSTWLRVDGEWLLRFHQGTLLAQVEVPSAPQ